MTEGFMIGLIFIIVFLGAAITAVLKAFFKFISGGKGGKKWKK